MDRKKPPKVVYIIQKANWHFDHGGSDCLEHFRCITLADGICYEGRSVCAFGDQDRAETHRCRLESQSRKTENPFMYGESWDDHLSSNYYSTPSYLRAALEDLGLAVAEPTPYAIEEWRHWWDSSRLTEEQAEAVWDLLDKVRFHEIISTELEGATVRRGAGKGKEPSAGRSLFVVHQVNWQETYEGGEWFGPPVLEAGRLLPGSPCRAFVERAEAEAFQTAQEEAVRAQRTPFACGDRFGDLSGAEEPLFHDYLIDLGLEPPPAEKRGRPRPIQVWRSWWQKTAPHLTPEQHRSIWQQMDRVCFFQLAEVPWEL
jgi:hypothetical protein